MRKEEDRVNESHTLWADTVIKRTADIVADSNWYPFVKSIEDILERLSFYDDAVERLENEIGETKGMIKNLRKILIKLELVDDRFII
jgi:hypothetical protein